MLTPERIRELWENYSPTQGIESFARSVEAAALESQSREIARVEAENDLLRQHAAEQISDATLLTGINIGNGSMNMGLQGGAAQMLAESFFDQFQKSEAVNYLELRFESESKMPGKAMVVTLQLVGGLTPGQKIADQAREIAALKEQVEGLIAARMAYASEFPLDGEGEPDVGSIHQNIRALKLEVEVLRVKAARYDYLTLEHGEFCVARPETAGSVIKAGAADSLIDAAIAAKGGSDVLP